MKRKDFKRLGLALAAAALMSAPIAQEAAVDANPVVFLEQVRAELAAGDIDAALDLIAQLRALGVVSIVIGDVVIDLNELSALVASGSTEALATVTELAAIAGTESAEFDVADTSITAEDDLDETFPIGSAG